MAPLAMTDSAAEAPSSPSDAGKTAGAVKKKKKRAGYKLGTLGLMILTGIIAFIGVATIVGGLQQLAIDSCSRADGLSCSVPAASQVPWLELAVGVTCLGILWLLLRKR